MAEVHPYHEAEHYEEPADMLGVLREELRLYPSPEEFCQNIATLERYYKETLLFDSFRKFDALNAKVHAPAGNYETAPHGLSMFYCGQILVAHTMVKPLPSASRQQVLAEDFFPNFARGLQRFDVNYEGHGIYVENLRDLQQTMWEKFSGDSSQEYQEKVVDAMSRMGGSQPNSWVAQDQFLCGFMFAEELVSQTLEEVGPEPAL